MLELSNRRVYEKGKITIPQPYLERNGIRKGDTLNCLAGESYMVITPSDTKLTLELQSSIKDILENNGR